MIYSKTDIDIWLTHKMGHASAKRRTLGRIYRVSTQWHLLIVDMYKSKAFICQQKELNSHRTVLLWTVLNTIICYDISKTKAKYNREAASGILCKSWIFSFLFWGYVFIRQMFLVKKCGVARVLLILGKI